MRSYCRHHLLQLVINAFAIVLCVGTCEWAESGGHSGRRTCAPPPSRALLAPAVVTTHRVHPARSWDCMPGPISPHVASRAPARAARHWSQIHEQKKIESFQRINSISETNGNFDSCNSCKRLVLTRLHELHESKLPFFMYRIYPFETFELSAHVSG